MRWNQEHPARTSLTGRQKIPRSRAAQGQTPRSISASARPRASRRLPGVVFADGLERVQDQVGHFGLNMTIQIAAFHVVQAFVYLRLL
jgi:hypothetical protein